MRYFGRRFRHKNRVRRKRGRACLNCEYCDTLADAKPGRCLRVRGFLPGLSTERRTHLQAYGVVPGHCVRVLQHSPVTVVQIEYTELALENDMARLIQVGEEV
jgi:Fe2+ transport system protein FeoA